MKMTKLIAALAGILILSTPALAQSASCDEDSQVSVIAVAVEAANKDGQQLTIKDFKGDDLLKVKAAYEKVRGVPFPDGVDEVIFLDGPGREVILSWIAKDGCLLGRGSFTRDVYNAIMTEAGLNG